MKCDLLKLTLALIIAAAPAPADPLLTSWSTQRSGQYCRVYRTKADALAGTVLTTWTCQTLPAYTDVQKVQSSDSWVYVTTIAETTTVIKTGGPATDVTMEAPALDTAAGNITLTWNSVEGGKYSIKASENLQSWATPQTGITATGLQTVRTATLPAAATSQFYKITLDSLATYDVTGSTGGGGPGGGGGIEGTQASGK